MSSQQTLTPYTLSLAQCEQASGGLAPALVAAYAVVTSETFLAWSASISLIGLAAEIGTEMID